MRILMLGNSFTFANHMPDILARLTGAEVVHHTRGGARLAEQLNEKTRMGKLTQSALWNEKWDDLAVFHINAVIFPPHRPF